MNVAINSQNYTVRLEGVEKSILSYMNQERKTDGPNSCGVILLANNIKHYAHKIVLSRFSDFFRRYFCDNPAVGHTKNGRKASHCTNDDGEPHESSRVRTIHLPGINSVELEPILEYMYTSTLELNAGNVNEILLVACLLQVTSVIEFCAEVLHKQPNWRSPLVSPRILNFVRQDKTAQKDSDTSSQTAVTWAAKGAKTSSCETRTKRREKTLTNDWTKHEVLRSGSGNPKPRKSSRIYQGGEHQSVVKRRCLTSSASPCSSSVAANSYSKSVYASSPESFDYPLTIDYDDLDRNMPRIQAGKLRSIFRSQEPQTLISRRLDAVERRLLRGKSGNSRDADSRPPPAKRKAPPGTSEQTGEYAFKMLPALTSEGLQTTMLPHLIDCRSLWHVAQASALGIPVYPSTYPNFPRSRKSETCYTTNTDGNLQMASEGSVSVSRADQSAINRCASDTSTFPHQVHMRRAMAEHELKTNSNTKYGEHKVYGGRLNSAMSLKQASVDKSGDGMQEKPMNLSQTVHRNTVNVAAIPSWQESTLVSDEIVVESSNRRRDSANSAKSCFGGAIRSDKVIVGHDSTDPVDYHKRKRKLLLGAPSHEALHSEWVKESKRVIKHMDEDSSMSKRTQCSSENGILAKLHQENNTIDFDSDDSGRPCSV